MEEEGGDTEVLSGLFAMSGFSGGALWEICLTCVLGGLFGPSRGVNNGVQPFSTGIRWIFTRNVVQKVDQELSETI